LPQGGVHSRFGAKGETIEKKDIRGLIMKKSRQQLKEELKAKSDVIIERLLKWNDENNEPNLTQIEDIVLELREEMGEGMVESVLQGQEKVQPAEGPKCKKCSKEMRYKGRKGKVVESRVGELGILRGYYYCPDCKAGIFPPG
jgi:hypothetical protein